MKIVTIEHEDNAEDPCERDQFVVHSFNRRHHAFAAPGNFFSEDGTPSPALAAQLTEETAFVLSYYEHGSCVWSRQGTGPQCQWDNVSLAGLLVWTGKPEDLGKDYDARAKAADGFLSAYTAWCNGEVYGYRVEEEITLPCGHTETREIESCYGFNGTDVDYMASEVAHVVNGDDVRFKGSAAFLADHHDFKGKKG